MPSIDVFNDPVFVKDNCQTKVTKKAPVSPLKRFPTEKEIGLNHNVIVRKMVGRFIFEHLLQYRIIRKYRSKNDLRVSMEPQEDQLVFKKQT